MGRRKGTKKKRKRPTGVRAAWVKRGFQKSFLGGLANFKAMARAKGKEAWGTGMGTNVVYSAPKGAQSHGGKKSHGCGQNPTEKKNIERGPSHGHLGQER